MNNTNATTVTPTEVNGEVITSYCTPGYSSTPGNRVEIREYDGPITSDIPKEFRTKSAKKKHLYEVVIWQDKKLALGPQTKENIARNTKIYRTAHPFAYISKVEGKLTSLAIKDKMVYDTVLNESERQKLSSDFSKISKIAEW